PAPELVAAEEPGLELAAEFRDDARRRAEQPLDQLHEFGVLDAAHLGRRRRAERAGRRRRRMGCHRARRRAPRARARGDNNRGALVVGRGALAVPALAALALALALVDFL